MKFSLPDGLAEAFKEVELELAGLGRPTSAIRTTGEASQQFFENANGIWVSRPSLTLYALFEDGRAFGYADNPRVGAPFDDRQLRLYTGTPQDKCPPQGGWAVLWRHDPSWKRMGYSRGSFGFTNGTIFYQRFEHGIIIGPLLEAPKSPKAEVVAIADNGNFRQATGFKDLAPAPHKRNSSCSTD